MTYPRDYRPTMAQQDARAAELMNDRPPTKAELARLSTPPVRVVHRSYGRGVTLDVVRFIGTVRVKFDDDRVPRSVMARDLVPEPVGMPANDEGVGA